MREADERYFETLETELDSAMAVAERARERGGDPKPEVEIPTARDMADRVENILGIDGVAERVRELEGEMSREEAALELVEDFVEGTVGDYDTREGKVEGAVRTAVALLTEGVVAAPIEGIDRVELLENDDGTEFINVYYAGPIRSAGGTAQALSVLVADYARALLGIEQYQAREEEIGRYAEEVDLYDKDTGLQYSPKEKETKFIAEHMPIMLDGEATGDEEVSGYRDLERVDSNSARGGMCLVLAEGIALKAPKIQRYTRNLDEIDWPWLQDLIDGTIGDDEGSEADQGEASDGASGEAAEGGEDAEEERSGPPRVDPAKKYLRDLIAGRPVFSHPSKSGGFRLRYGRARNHGFATAGVHPATMHLVDDFLATGTQIKTERPGKAAGVVPVDSIEGPTVRLANGDVRRIDDVEEAREVGNGVEKILDLGEYLVNYGEFVENNHPLAPASYTVEWWEQDLEAAGADVQAMRDDPGVDLASPSVGEALDWATGYDAPLHPKYTYCWHDVTIEQFGALADAVDEADVTATDGAVVESPEAADGDLVLENTDRVRSALERLLVEHTQEPDRLVVPDWLALVRTLGFSRALEREWTVDDLSEHAKTYGEQEAADAIGYVDDELGEEAGRNAIEAVNEVSPFEVMERAPTRIGNRMGRPEKSERRDLSPAVHTLFPIGEAGGAQRDVAAATKHADSMSETPGRVEVEVARRRCPECGTEGHEARCPACDTLAETIYVCPDCETEVELDESGRAECARCETLASPTQYTELDVQEIYRDALDNAEERETAFDTLKAVKGLTSEAKLPEPMEKGILRAKHDVSAFKDGTVRYDMTDLPVTALRPAELDVDPDRLRALGYETDIHGDPLTHPDQLFELKVQDIVLSDGAAEHMLQTAAFVDDLLEQYYGLDRYYEFDDRNDLVGELVFGMAPHTSAATVGRVIGFTTAAVGYAHPYFHAAKRRNCFHPETRLWSEDADGEWEYGTIEELVESRLENPRTDDFGTQVQDLDGDLVVQSLGDGGPCRKPVEAVSKHPAPDHMVRIEVGEETLEVTPDHTMVRAGADGITEAPASSITEGDELPVYDGGETTKGSTDAAVPATDGSGVPTASVTAVEYIESGVDHVYCLTVADTHTVAVEGMYSAQCDGDEDCVMLLMDGLLNFSKSYLPDQRGGSVAEDSRLVAVDPKGNVRFLTFEEFWKRLESPLEVDGKFRKRTCATEGWQTYAFDQNHEASLQPIEKAIRYQADDDEQLLNVETQFGRSIEITANHSLFRYDEGIEEVAGDELEAGDLLVAPQSLDIAGTETTIDAAECVETPYVVIDDHVEDLLRTVWETTDRGSDVHTAFKSGLEYRLSKEKIPLDRFETILDEAGYLVPPDVTIALAGSTDGIDRTIDVDEEFGWLLGLFVAEGTTSSVCPAIHNADEEIIDRAAEITATTLGHEPERRWSNRAYELRFPAVFREILYSFGFEERESYSSSEKVVPECIRTAPEPVVKAFLRGFIAGDGSETSDDNHTTIQFHSTSEDVRDGIVYLLHRLGLVANISTRRGRDGNRQDIYSVTVSGGANDNPLRDILDGKEPYQPKSLVVGVPGALLDIREMDIKGVKQLIPKYLKRRENISLEKLEELVTELSNRELPEAAQTKLGAMRPLVDGDLAYVRVKNVERVDYDGYLYDLQVGGEPIFLSNWLYAHNSMDAPLVMSSRIDPSEIDDEAHNMDIMDRYPREFYEATRELTDPAEVEDIMSIAEETLGTDREYTDFRHTNDTTNIAAGPDLSAYKTLGSMEEKMDAQLHLSRKLRAVVESDVAERIIEYHFLPDLIGNLRAFSRQEVRCLDCGEKYRRMPLTGDCRECGGRVNLTVHEGSVNKYIDTAIRVADEFGARDYTKQRLQILERKIESVFQNDHNKQSGIADFM